MQSPSLHSPVSVLVPAHVPLLFSVTDLDRVLVIVPASHVSEQADQDCHDAHSQSTR